MPSPITVGLNLSHQHSHGKMSQNIVAGSNYQANPAVIATKLDPTICHCVPSSTFVYILCTYLPTVQDRQEWINFHPLLRKQRKKA